MKSLPVSLAALMRLANSIIPETLEQNLDPQHLIRDVPAATLLRRWVASGWGTSLTCWPPVGLHPSSRGCPSWTRQRFESRAAARRACPAARSRERLNETGKKQRDKLVVECTKGRVSLTGVKIRKTLNVGSNWLQLECQIKSSCDIDKAFCSTFKVLCF